MPPPKHFVRRRDLICWLAHYGFTNSQVDQMIRDGVIPQEHFKTARHKRLRLKPRAYYKTLRVAQVLHLSL